MATGGPQMESDRSRPGSDLLLVQPRGTDLTATTAETCKK